MDNKYFDELKILYRDFKNDYKTKKYIDFSSVVKTKGRMYDVFPYQHERLGNKTKAKIVDEIELKDDNFIFYFDNMGRIICVEEAISYSNKLYYFENYEYIDNKVYAYYCTLHGVNRVAMGIYNDKKLAEKYIVYDMERFAYEKYTYSGDLLYEIETYLYNSKEIRNWKERFYYNSKGVLELIQKVEGVWKETRYCRVKINRKKLESNIKTTLLDYLNKGLFGNHFAHNKVINCNLQLETDTSVITLCDANISEEKKQIIVREYPLDTVEKEKIIDIVLKTVFKLWDEKILDKRFALKVMKDGKNILEDTELLPRWVKKNEQIILAENLIRYQEIDNVQAVEKKTIKQIYDNYKKSTNNKMSLSELVCCFEKMASVSAKNGNYEYLEDEYLLEMETVSYKNNLMFGISLIRQIPYKEEFVQIGIEIIYEITENNKLISYSQWSKDLKDFILDIKKTEVFKLECNEKVKDIRIFMQET